MITKRLFYLFTLLICQLCTAQQKITQIPTAWTKLYQNAKLDYFSSADQKYLGLVVNNGDSTKIIITNSLFKILYQFGIGRNSFERFSGGFIKNDSIAIFMERENNIHAWTCSVKTGKITDYNIPFKQTGEQFIGIVNTGKKYLNLFIKKSDPILIIYDFGGNGVYDRKEYDLGQQSLNSRLNGKDLSKSWTKSKFLHRVTDVSIIQNTEPQIPENCINPTKLYIRKDSLFIISNKIDQLVEIYSLDLKNKSASYRNVNYESVFASEDSVVSFNSFLDNDKLYYVIRNKDSLKLFINDFYSGKEIKQYTTSKEDELIFNHLSINSINASSINTHSKSIKYREYKSVKDFLSKTSDEVSLIYAYQNSNGSTELTIGTIGKEYKLGNSYDRPMSYNPGFGYTSTVSGPIIEKWKTVNKLNFQINPETSQLSPRNIPFSIFEKIDHYKTGLNIRDDAQIVINFHNDIYLLYLNTIAGNINIVKYSQ
jgi:hypothetical protein